MALSLSLFAYSRAPLYNSGDGRRGLLHRASDHSMLNAHCSDSNAITVIFFFLLLLLTLVFSHDALASTHTHATLMYIFFTLSFSFLLYFLSSYLLFLLVQYKHALPAIVDHCCNCCNCCCCSDSSWRGLLRFQLLYRAFTRSPILYRTGGQSPAIISPKACTSSPFSLSLSLFPSLFHVSAY